MSGGAKLRAAVAGRSAAGNLVDPASGQAVAMTEARRVSLAIGAVKAAAAVPEVCSPAIPVAPGRGPMTVHRPFVAVATASGPRVRREAFPGGAPARVASALDLLERASRRRDSGPLFSVAQHIAAAEYVALFERVNSGRVKCVDLSGARSGDGAGSVMDAIVGDIQRLRRMTRAIGSGVVLSARGSAAQAGRRSVRADGLVAWVLIRGESLSALLGRYGWGCQTKYRERLQHGLAAALDRLHGL